MSVPQCCGAGALAASGSGRQIHVGFPTRRWRETDPGPRAPDSCEQHDPQARCAPRHVRERLTRTERAQLWCVEQAGPHYDCQCERDGSGTARPLRSQRSRGAQGVGCYRNGRRPEARLASDQSLAFPWMRKHGLGPGRLSPLVHSGRGLTRLETLALRASANYPSAAGGRARGRARSDDGHVANRTGQETLPRWSGLCRTTPTRGKELQCA
jgi:hypothetical protein